MTVALEATWPYLTMFVAAFGAATLLPFSSELVLLAHLKAGTGDRALLITAATIGNVGGSTLNWWIGSYARALERHRWFPFAPETVEAASVRFRRWGVWVLLLSWLPVVGDPLTFIAGVMRVPLAVFLPLVAIGKLGRYLVVAWLT